MAISFVGASSAIGNTVSLPAHQPGDLILIAAVRFTSGFFTSAPNGWLVGAYRNSLNSMGAILAYRTAESSSENVGNYSGADIVIATIYRDDTYTLTVGSTNQNGTGLSSALNYPPLIAIPLTGGGVGMVRDQFGSWVAGIGWARSAALNVETPPSGMVFREARANATGEIAMHDTNADVTSWANTNVTLSDSAPNGAFIAEIKKTGFAKSSGVGPAGFTGIRGVSRRLGT